MDERSFQVTVKGICFDEQGQVLLIQENTGRWDLPGGRMEHGEDFHTTLSRECREEMGIDCRILDEHPYWAWPALHDDGLWKVVLCFRIALPHLMFTASDECIALDFVNVRTFDERTAVLQIHPLRDHLAALSGA